MYHYYKATRDQDGETRLVVRRRYLYMDTPCEKRLMGVDFNKKLCCVCWRSCSRCRWSAEGVSSWRSIASNNSLLCGNETVRVPRHNLIELEKTTYPQFWIKAAATQVIHFVVSLTTS